MEVENAFERARQIGSRHDLVQGQVYEIPADATHVLIRPKRRGAMLKLIVAFFEADYTGDYKPSGNTGKYFYRENGAKQCRIRATLKPSGWDYGVEWLAE